MPGGTTVGGHQGHELIKALTQIAFAGCVADLWVPTGEHDLEGKERFLQIKGRFSRMSVYAIGEHHLTDEELAQKSFDFDLEDVLYIRLDPLEAKLQQLQDRRILDAQPYWPKSIYRVYIKRAADKIGLGKHIGWHTFRHTFGTILNANGENPKVIQELMRHANLKVTMDTYVQAVTDEKREAQNKVVKMLLPGIRRAVI